MVDINDLNQNLDNLFAELDGAVERINSPDPTARTWARAEIEMLKVKLGVLIHGLRTDYEAKINYLESSFKQDLDERNRFTDTGKGAN